ncbi:MAG: arginine deiminase family protein [Candidatus Aminicenantes bacterium]|nr:arginine deiminase family protein [Candidatus Aminicenantes bacterium]
MVKSEADKLHQVIICPPEKEYFKITNLEIHNLQAVADPKLTIKQHSALKNLLKKFRCKVILIRELKNHPNSVFVRDTALVTPQGFIQLRMGLSSRRGEEHWMARFLSKLGLPCAGKITPPGTAEGGDIILAWPVAFIGQSKRTNEAGTTQLARFLERMGYEIRIVMLPNHYLHLGGVMSVIGPQTVLCVRDILPRDLLDGFKVISIPDESPTGGNVICLGEGKLIAEKSNKAAIKALIKTGFTVFELDLSEFIKGSGGPTCLILPLERKFFK